MDEIVASSVLNVFGFMNKEDREEIAGSVKTLLVDAGFDSDRVTVEVLTKVLREEHKKNLLGIIRKTFPFIRQEG